jgi:hypothetical protein
MYKCLNCNKIFNNIEEYNSHNKKCKQSSTKKKESVSSFSSRISKYSDSVITEIDNDTEVNFLKPSKKGSKVIESDTSLTNITLKRENDNLKYQINELESERETIKSDIKTEYNSKINKYKNLIDKKYNASLEKIKILENELNIYKTLDDKNRDFQNNKILEVKKEYDDKFQLFIKEYEYNKESYINNLKLQFTQKENKLLNEIETLKSLLNSTRDNINKDTQETINNIKLEYTRDIHKLENLKNLQDKKINELETINKNDIREIEERYKNSQIIEERKYQEIIKELSNSLESQKSMYELKIQEINNNIKKISEQEIEKYKKTVLENDLYNSRVLETEKMANKRHIDKLLKA